MTDDKTAAPGALADEIDSVRRRVALGLRGRNERIVAEYDALTARVAELERERDAAVTLAEGDRARFTQERAAFVEQAESLAAEVDRLREALRVAAGMAHIAQTEGTACACDRCAQVLAALAAPSSAAAALSALDERERSEERAEHGEWPCEECDATLGDLFASDADTPGPTGGWWVCGRCWNAKLAENEGPGTPTARWHSLMDALEKRFPDPEPHRSDRVSEEHYLAAIDALPAEVQESEARTWEIALAEGAEGNTRCAAAIGPHDAQVCRVALTTAAAHFRTVPHHAAYYDGQLGPQLVSFGNLAADTLDALAATPAPATPKEET